jgi:hypothetical protein
VIPGLGQQGGHVLAFEGDGRALRVVFVVGVVGLRRGHDLAELPLQPGHLLQHGLLLRRQGHAYPGRLRLLSGPRSGSRTRVHSSCLPPGRLKLRL